MCSTLCKGLLAVLSCALFVFNVVFGICGFSFLVLGVAFHLQVSQYDVVMGSEFTSNSIILISIGCFMLVLSIIGCCGAITRNALCLGIYGGLLLLFCMVEIIASSVIYVHLSQFDKYLRPDLEKNIKESIVSYNHSEKITNALDDMQRSWKCCGALGPEDYRPVLDGKLPNSCCINPRNPCTLNDTKPALFYEENCIEYLKVYAKKAEAVAIVVLAFTCSIEMLFVIITLCLTYYYW